MKPVNLYVFLLAHKDATCEKYDLVPESKLIVHMTSFYMDPDFLTNISDDNKPDYFSTPDLEALKQSLGKKFMDIIDRVNGVNLHFCDEDEDDEDDDDDNYEADERGDLNR